MAPLADNETDPRLLRREVVRLKVLHARAKAELEAMTKRLAEQLRENRRLGQENAKLMEENSK